MMSGAALGQTYVISTLAGGAVPPTPVEAARASIGQPQGVTTDSSGSVYFTSLQCVFKSDASGVLTQVAGNARPGYPGDGGPATSAQLSSPTSVAVDGSGNLYIADSGSHRVRKVSPSGIITTVAGTGINGFSGDGGPATSARLYGPRGLAVDGSGNLYVADVGNHRIRKVSPSGIITTVAGNGTGGYSGDSGLATSAGITPLSVTPDGVGNLYIADGDNNRIRKVSPTGVITTVAGTGTFGFSGDAGPATSAKLYGPAGLAVDGSGNLYVADAGNHRIRRVSPSGIITTVAGTGDYGYSGDGGPATSAKLYGPVGLAFDGSGNLYFADTNNYRIRKVSVSGIITTAAGNGAAGYSGDNGPATSAQLKLPCGIAVDGLGNLYIADYGNDRIRKVSPSGIITTVAGDGNSGYGGDGGPATKALLEGPTDVAVDGSGALYIADQAFNLVRKVSPSGIITTVVGTGSYGYSGDGGPAASAQIGFPTAVAVDGSGNLYIADPGNLCIRKVSPGGIITTVAGMDLHPGYGGDGGPATKAQLLSPTDVSVDGSGNLYIADSGNYRIRKVSPSGIITTVAGTFRGYSGDGGPATSALLYDPRGVAVDRSGNLYVADSAANAVRLLQPTAPSLSTSTPSPLPQGTVGVAYSQTLSASGGTSPYTWSVTSGALPGGLALSSSGTISGAPTAAGTFGFTVQVRDSASTTAIKAFALTVATRGPAPVFSAAGVVSAASSVGGGVAPGEIVSLYGTNFGPAIGVPNSGYDSTTGRLPTTLGGVSVSFDGQAAPLFFVSSGQINTQVPYAVSGRLATSMVVTYGGVASAAVSVPVVVSHPGVFVSGNRAIITNTLTGALINASNPIPRNGYVTIWAAGPGVVSPAASTGGPAPSSPLSWATNPQAWIGGNAVEVQFAGMTPGAAGLFQINLKIPATAPTGADVALKLSVNGTPAQAFISGAPTTNLTIAIQ